jgi:hypothetical protein
MPDMQSSASQASGGTAANFAAIAQFDDDVVLGFECADPALQIERWHLEAGGGADAS